MGKHWVFNTGVPGGSPSYTTPYKYQNRLNAYKRADIGILYVFTDTKKFYGIPDFMTQRVFNIKMDVKF